MCFNFLLKQNMKKVVKDTSRVTVTLTYDTPEVKPCYPKIQEKKASLTLLQPYAIHPDLSEYIYYA